MAVGTDYKELVDMMRRMDGYIREMKVVSESTIIGIYELNPDIKEVIMNMTDEEIENISEENYKDILAKGNCDYEKFNAAWQTFATPESNQAEDLKKAFKEYKSAMDNVKELESNRDKVNKEIEEVTDNWFEYANSVKYKEKTQAKIDELRGKLEEETNETEKRRITKMLNTLEDRNSLTFLFNRIEKNPESEIKSIKEAFFDSRKSALVVKKFKSKLPRFNLNENIYKMFFNLEENFLPEEYHDLNNAFLFHIMRYVSHCDPYDKYDSMKVSAILLKLYTLVYHKFGDTESEQEFVDIIKRFDDYLIPYKSEFTEKNVLSPNHPARKKHDEQRRRQVLINSLIDLDIEPDTSLSTEELQRQYDEATVRKMAEGMNLVEDLSVDSLSKTDDGTYIARVRITQSPDVYPKIVLFYNANLTDDMVENYRNETEVEEPDTVEFDPSIMEITHRTDGGYDVLVPLTCNDEGTPIVWINKGCESPLEEVEKLNKKGASSREHMISEDKIALIKGWFEDWVKNYKTSEDASESTEVKSDESSITTTGNPDGEVTFTIDSEPVATVNRTCAEDVNVPVIDKDEVTPKLAETPVIEPLIDGNFEYINDTESTEASDDEFVVERRPNGLSTTKNDTPTGNKYYDIFDGYYAKVGDTGLFGYYNSDDKRYGEEVFPEEDLLKLVGTGVLSLNKKMNNNPIK